MEYIVYKEFDKKWMFFLEEMKTVNHFKSISWNLNLLASKPSFRISKHNIFTNLLAILKYFNDDWRLSFVLSDNVWNSFWADFQTSSCAFVICC